MKCGSLLVLALQFDRIRYEFQNILPEFMSPRRHRSQNTVSDDGLRNTPNCEPWITGGKLIKQSFEKRGRVEQEGVVWEILPFECWTRSPMSFVGTRKSLARLFLEPLSSTFAHLRLDRGKVIPGVLK
jgi:hypothetical protein